MKKSLLTLGIVLFALSFSGLAWAGQTGYVKVSGYVSFAGVPADGCDVNLKSKPTGFAAKNTSATTDASGYYELTDDSIKCKTVSKQSQLRAVWKPTFFDGALKLKFDNIDGTTILNDIIFPACTFPGQDIDIEEDIDLLFDSVL